MREEIILQKIYAGDPAGLEALMERYIPYVSAVVWNILRNSMPLEDGEEVVSDVFLAAWRQPSALRPGSVKSWLGAVARNKAKNRLRRMDRTLPLEEDALDIPGPDDPPGDLERAEERRLVRQAVDSLPGQDREIFLRHYYYTQTVQEISLCMCLNESTVKTKLRRGRMKLKEILTREGFLREA
ncbi:RNA polymerase sigma factor [Pseudoflavonifractor sp. 60]|uniref:RNA polymerase sigma factor n=1 Tax=Pseudoflavonifractor sp. 60 TaxID=2304576 RepID=UPI00136B04C0|nr:RNA polymerase sigma factor [Pseudoflavonifractor sp. 60]